MRSLLTVGVLLASAAFAQAQATVIRTTTIVGTSVTLQEQSLGKVVDIVLSDSGCVEYLVVAYNDQYIPVPYSVVRIQNNTILITAQNVTRQQLVGLAFTGANYPSFSN